MNRLAIRYCHTGCVVGKSFKGRSKRIEREDSDSGGRMTWSKCYYHSMIMVNEFSLRMGNMSKEWISKEDALDSHPFNLVCCSHIPDTLHFSRFLTRVSSQLNVGIVIMEGVNLSSSFGDNGRMDLKW